MKKWIAILIVLAPITVFSQWSVGPQVSIGKSELYNDIETIRTEENFTEYRNSYAVGVVGAYKFNNWLLLQADLLYDQLNSKYFYFVDGDNRASSYRTTEVEKVSYLSVPLSVGISFKRLRVNIGYQPSLLLSGSSTITTIDQVDNVTTVPFKGGGVYSKMNHNLMMSLSYQIHKDLYFEGRLVKGLRNMIDTRTGFVYNQKSNQLLIGLNYRFDLKKKTK